MENCLGRSTHPKHQTQLDVSLHKEMEKKRTFEIHQESFTIYDLGYGTIVWLGHSIPSSSALHIFGEPPS